MSSSFQTLFAIILGLILTACGFTRDKEVASRAVDVFHQRLDDARFTEIYQATTPAFKAQHAEADMTRRLETIRRELGALRSAEQRGWFVKAGTRETLVVLSYESQFEKGSASEKLTFVLSGGTAFLQQFHVRSPALSGE